MVSKRRWDAALSEHQVQAVRRYPRHACPATAHRPRRVQDRLGRGLDGAGKYGSVFPTAFVDWDLTEDEYTQHLEWKQPKDEAVKEALTLLGAAGITKDKPLKFSVLFQANNQSITAGVQLLQAQWKKFGAGALDPQLKGVDQQSINATRVNGQFDYAFTGIRPAWSTPTSGSGRRIARGAA